MKPTIHGTVVHSDRPRQHSRLHRPLRYAFREIREELKDPVLQRDLLAIIIYACIAAACVVAILGLQGVLK